ncbi:oligosaccharide flippase family protein [Roseateles sp.]|uniref:oligosaccharide flippase family protein n=1 Tax=Roseateles sp. TaxID=1971397 RepID=UPI00286A0B85|nr:oligosaccharide flippase family protein [Roseateles sp.]
MSLRKSIFISALSANSLTLIGIVSSMIIARILTPTDLGAYAIAAVFVGLAHQFRDFGTSTYLVQCQTIDKESLGKALGLTVLSATALGLLVMALAPLAGWFYQTEQITYVLFILGVNFFIVPFGANTLAILRRDMRFRERAIIDHASSITGLVVSCACAWRGYGALSLAFGTLFSTIATTLCAGFYRPKQHPWSIQFRNLKDIFSFGVSATASAMITQLNRGVIEIIGGRFAGLEAVAFFNKAKSVTDHIGALLLGVAHQVTLPVLSESHRKGELLAPIYLRTAALLTGFMWPACAFAAIFPLDILHFMFGPQWDAAAPMLQLMCLLTALSSPLWLWSQPMFALGRPKPVLWGEILHLVCLLFGLAILAWGLKSSNLALAMIFTPPFVLGYAYRTLQRNLNFTHREFVGALWPSAQTAVAVACTAYLLATVTEEWHLAPRLLMSSVLCGIAWLAGIFIAKHPLKAEVMHVLRYTKLI